MPREDEHLLRVLSLHAEAQRRAQAARRFRQHLHPAQFFVHGQKVHAVARLRPDHARTAAPVHEACLIREHLVVHLTRLGEGRREDRERPADARIGRRAGARRRAGVSSPEDVAPEIVVPSICRRVVGCFMGEFLLILNFRHGRRPLLFLRQRFQNRRGFRGPIHGHLVERPEVAFVRAGLSDADERATAFGGKSIVVICGAGRRRRWCRTSVRRRRSVRTSYLRG